MYKQWDFGAAADRFHPAPAVGVDAKDRSGYGSYWIQSTARNPEGGNAKLADFDVKSYWCPSDPTTIPCKGNLSYVVNGGFSYHWRLDYATTGDGRGKLLDFSDPVQRRWSDNVRNSGIFFLETSEAYAKSFKPPLKTSDRGSLRLKEIGDGLANTVMIAENINAGVGAAWATKDLPSNWACPHPWNTSFFVNGVLPPPGANGALDFAAANNRGPDAPPLKPFGPQGGINGDLSGKNEGRFPYPNSAHDKVVHVLLCDGSVRSISQNIDPAVWAAMVTPNGSKFVRLSDGKIIGEPAVTQDD